MANEEDKKILLDKGGLRKLLSLIGDWLLDWQTKNIVPIEGGGTGATDAKEACENLQAYHLGLGTEIPAGADLNDYLIPGVYRTTGYSVTASLANKPQEVTNSFTMIVYQNFASAVTQQITDNTKGVSYRRYCNIGGTFDSWVCVDGIDSIVAEGNTSGWRWTKYANGRAECHVSVSGAATSSVTQGSMYLTSQFTLAFPFTFVEEPDVTMSGGLGYSATGIGYMRPTVSNVAFNIWSDGVTFTSQAYRYSVHVVGRWK